MRTLPALAAIVVLSCTAGAPPAFPKGDRWTFPLVGTLEGGQLIVPVSVENTGPYLMVIDPDADASVIDEAIVKQLGAQTGRAGDILDETDTIRHRGAAEIKSLTLGNLTVGRQYYGMMKAGGFQIAGRDIRGIIGHDILADALAFGYDRERGVGYLVTQSQFKPPTGSTEVGYSLYDVVNQGQAGSFSPPTMASDQGPCSGIQPGEGDKPCTTGGAGISAGTASDLSGHAMLATGRRMVHAQIGGLTADMHLDLGSPISQLRQSLWPKAGLAPVAASFDFRDEAGTVHHAIAGGIADTVSIGGALLGKAAFGPYDDKRWDPEYIDGTIGLDALRAYNVWANSDSKHFYLTPRGDVLATAKERISRWQAPVLEHCADGGCAQVKLLVPTAPASGPAPTTDPAAAPVAPAPPSEPAKTRTVIMVSRDASTANSPIELVLAPMTTDGKLAPLPFLVINLPADANDASTQLGPEFAGLDLRVVDASPYPRACGHAGGCIDSIVP